MIEFETLHGVGRERARDERALLVMRGVVLGDHVLFTGDGTGGLAA